jgi:hypothetical protein
MDQPGTIELPVDPPQATNIPDQIPTSPIVTKEVQNAAQISSSGIEQQIARAATSEVVAASTVDEDDVQFVFSVPRRRKKKRKRSVKYRV